MKTFKVKIGGGKFKARFMNPDEKINEKSLYAYNNYGGAEAIRSQILEGKNVQLFPSKCVGELVGEHAPDKRVYIEVLSAHYATFPDPMND